MHTVVWIVKSSPELKIIPFNHISATQKIDSMHLFMSNSWHTYNNENMELFPEGFKKFQ